MSSMNTSKMYHKGSVWSHHGKKAGRLAWCCLLNRLAAQRAAKAKAKRERGPWYDSVYECLNANGIR